MPALSGDPIFQMQWVRSAPKHSVVVVALDEYGVEFGNGFMQALEDVTEVGEQAETLSRVDVFDDEANTLDGIVGRSYRLDSERADLKGPTGDKIVGATDAPGRWFGAGSVPSSQVGVHGQTEFTVKHPDATDVIVVFVREEQSSAIANVVAEFGQPRLGFTPGDARIKE